MPKYSVSPRERTRWKLRAKRCGFLHFGRRTLQWTLLDVCMSGRPNAPFRPRASPPPTEQSGGGHGPVAQAESAPEGLDLIPPITPPPPAGHPPPLPPPHPRPPHPPPPPPGP